MEKQVAATPEKIQQLRELCDKYGLEGRAVLERYTNEELSENIYNGAGPDSWISGAREVLTKLMSLFEPVVLIHDVQFSESDALHETFELSVDVWNQNSKKIFDAEYPLGTCRRLPASCRYGVMRAGTAAAQGLTRAERGKQRRQDENSS